MTRRRQYRARRAGRALLVLPALFLGSVLWAGEGFRAPPPLATIAGTADVIVVGTIRSVNEQVVRLEATQVIHPAESDVGDSFTVRRTDRFHFEPRWAPPAESQRVLMFLDRRPQNGKADWRFAADAADSEWPVADGVVYFHNRFIKGLPLEQVEIRAHRFPAQHLPLGDVKGAFRDFRSCFRWTGNTPAEPGSPQQTCDTSSIDSMAKRTPLHRQLIRETRRLIESSPAPQASP